jgi:hypothetical protein
MFQDIGPSQDDVPTQYNANIGQARTCIDASSVIRTYFPSVLVAEEIPSLDHTDTDRQPFMFFYLNEKYCIIMVYKSQQETYHM